MSADLPDTPVPAGRPTYGTLMSRALKLVCPRCGQGPLFRSWFRMHDTCSQCHFRFQRGPGYYLGSIYINYGLTAVLTTAMFLFGMFGLKLPKETITPPIVLFTLIFPVLLFRYARAWWLAMDCHFDREVLQDSHERAEDSDASGDWATHEAS